MSCTIIYLCDSKIAHGMSSRQKNSIGDTVQQMNLAFKYKIILECGVVTL